MKPLAPNSLIQNRYLVVQLIGKGGMGDVYLAVDQRLGSAIALKRTFFTDDDNLKMAFEREAKTLARLRHPVLPKVSDHFTEGDTQFLVMEHISGDDLGDRLEQNKKPFPLSWVLFWADQLLDALAYLHSHEPPIIHRDIKPQNLKLTNENHIILLDFGLAKNSVGETRLSTTGDVIAYTPHYASMEQIRGTGTTARSDIYSLSATMFQLLTNVVPPDALSRADSILGSLPDPIQALSEINPEVSPAISSVIMKGLNLSSEQRYANAREMQTALREAYSQIQQSSTAQTIAFNTNEVAATPETASGELKTIPLTNSTEPIGEKTAVMSRDIGEKTAVMPMDVGVKTEVMPSNLAAEPQPTANLDFPIPSPDNADATLPFVAPLVFDQVAEKPVEGDKTAVMPSDLASEDKKTEVMPVNSSGPIGEKTAVMPFDIPSSVSEKTEAFVSDLPAPTQENIATPPSNSYAAETTVPLVAYDGPISEVSNQPKTANFISSQPTGANTGNYKGQPEPETIPPVVPEPQKKAAGGSKMFAIVAVILGLGVIGILGAGVGIYLIKPEILGISATTPTPTPASSPESTPTPAISPSPESTMETANSNTGSSNSDTTNVNSVDSNTNTTKTPEIVKDKTPVVEKTTPQPTATRPVVNPTSQPTKPPTPKPTPSTKPTVCRTCPLQ